MSCSRTGLSALTVFLLGALAPVSSARAELVLSQLVVELSPRDHARADVEAWNNGKERIFVAVEPRQIVAPGLQSQSSLTEPDPDKLGLLVSPARMILEPGQRKLLRIGALGANDRERVYRVTVKPVVGKLSTESAGLKVLVGYDMLIIVRPSEVKPHVTAKRGKNKLELVNDGNVSVELVDGRACDRAGKACADLPTGRIYAGGAKTIAVDDDMRVDYQLKVGTRLIKAQF